MGRSQFHRAPFLTMLSVPPIVFKVGVTQQAQARLQCSGAPRRLRSASSLPAGVQRPLLADDFSSCVGPASSGHLLIKESLTHKAE